MTHATDTTATTDDPFLWLEDIYGDRQLEWVRAENALTEDTLVTPDFEQRERSILEVLDSTDRIPMAGKHGDFYYNFWRDAEHRQGIWRRTTWDSYASEDPAWELLLDVDALSAAEGTEWVWAGALFLRPAEGAPHERVLVALSPDGGDATRYREFD